MPKMNQWIVDHQLKNYAFADYSKCQLNCSLGVNQEDLPAGVMESLQTASIDEIKQYYHPVAFTESLIKKYAQIATLTEDNLLLGCGSHDMMHVLNKLLLHPGATALGFAPQFAGFIDAIKMTNSTFLGYTLNAEDNYKANIDGFIQYIESYESSLEMIYIDNPNNPTGQIIPIEDVRRIAEVARKKDVALVVDEAYGGFMPDSNTAINLIEEFDNVFVMRTMSKGYGMAGMRLGVMFSCVDNMNVVRKLLSRYSGNPLSQRLAHAMLTLAPDYLDISMEQNKKKKKAIRDALAGSWIKVAYSADTTPISLLYVEDHTVDLAAVLADHGIAAVSGGSFETMGAYAVRLMAPKETDIPLLVELLTNAANANN